MTTELEVVETFWQKYKKDGVYFGIVIVLVASGFGFWYIKDQKHSKAMAETASKLASLNSDYTKLNADKIAADTNAANALSLYKIEHAKLIAQLKKKPVQQTTPTTPLEPLPVIPSSTNLDDCNKLVQQLTTDNNDCITVVTTLQTDKQAAEAVINNLKDTVITTNKETEEAKAQTVSETKRKVWYRNGLLVETGWIILHILTHGAL